jgi:tripartite-type tricarboxylate transporter receptor subunit TctC
MQPVRRRFLQLSISALLATPAGALGQTYPTRSPHIIVGFPPGTSSDMTARLIGQWLSNRLGQQFVIENRPGVGTNIATEAVARAAPDGYTLLLMTQTNAINATLYEKLNFNVMRDLVPIAGIMRVPGVMEVHPSVPVRTLGEFIAYAKANPGRINMASGGNGSAQHLYGELFKLMTGIDMLHVPYPRSNPLTDLLGGQVQVMFAPIPSSIEHIRAGALRALAVTTASRLDLLPDLPTVAEAVPGYEAGGWFGIGAPRDTPMDIVDRLNREINTGLSDSAIKAKFADLGGIVMAGSPADFAKLIADETAKWGKVVRAAGIRAE